MPERVNSCLINWLRVSNLIIIINFVNITVVDNIAGADVVGADDSNH